MKRFLFVCDKRLSIVLYANANVLINPEQMCVLKSGKAKDNKVVNCAVRNKTKIMSKVSRKRGKQSEKADILVI